LASPIIRDDNHRWGLVPDAEGRMHLVDLNPLDVELEPRFDATTDIRLLLRTRSNPTSPQLIQMTQASLAASNFNPAHPTRFTIHGWTMDEHDVVNTLSAVQYFIRGEFNHITVDWSAGAQTINYIAARNRVDDVGRFIASFIDFCHLHGFINFSTLHVIGHSLGGHAAGMTGKFVTRGRIQVIYSLDPAGPLFSLAEVDRRVDASDAVYVEVIHSNGNILGFGDPIGDADFYPNGGNYQPGCGTDLTGSCAHDRAVAFFIESINSSRFVGIGCTTFASVTSTGCTQTAARSIMGRESATNGIFWLPVASGSPFALG